MNIDHERCSEMLGPFVRGELDASEAAEVQEHLQTCEDCSAEGEAAAALQEMPVLTELESARLRSEVWRTADTSTGFNRKIAPWLGAAAAIAVLAVGIVTAGDSGDDAARAPEPETMQEQLGADADSDTADSAEGGGVAPDEPASMEVGDASTDIEEQITGGPVFAPRGRIHRNELRALGRAGEPFVTYAQTYGSRDRRVIEELRTQLVGQVQGVEPGLEPCITALTRERLLPAFAATGKVAGEPTWVTGGVIIGDDAPRYRILVFDRGSCDEPRLTLEGAIRP